MSSQAQQQNWKQSQRFELKEHIPTQKNNDTTEKIATINADHPPYIVLFNSKNLIKQNTSKCEGGSWRWGCDEIKHFH